jgi:chondroitin 4-sulfotransferase 11
MDIFNQKTKHWNDYFTFAFVRDPYEHFLSVFLYLQKHKAPNTENFHKYAIVQGNTNYSSLSDWNFTGLFDRISDEDDNIIVDFVGRFENLQDDWRVLTQKIGLNNLDLVHINSSDKKGKSLEDFYGEEEREIVRSLYKKDFEKLGYEWKR